MFEDSPIKKILFDKLVEMGRLPPNPSESTIQTINDISDSEALQLLRSVGVGPTISKAGGGMMNIDEMIRPIGMAGGGSLGDSVIELDTLVKIMELEGALPNKDTDNLRKMSASAIDKLYKDTFGGKK